MLERGLHIFGMLGARRLMASDDARGAPPPLPIVDDTLAMMRDLEKELGRVARVGESYCVVLVRPDGVQDEDLAPQVVNGIGKRLSISLRPYDSIYRFGEDMFLLGVSHIKPEDATTVMERLRDVMSSRLLTMEDGRVVPATASLGATMLDGQISLQENLDRVGRALYVAARNGGNAIRMWSPDLAEE